MDDETADHTDVAEKKKSQRQVRAKPDIRADGRSRRQGAREATSQRRRPSINAAFFQRILRRQAEAVSLRPATAAPPNPFGPVDADPPNPQVLSNVYPKLLSMTERVKRLIGLAPRQTGNKLIINCEKLERRVALLENGVLEEYSHRARDRPQHRRQHFQRPREEHRARPQGDVRRYRLRKKRVPAFLGCAARRAR